MFCRNHRENDAALHKDTGKVAIPSEDTRIRIIQPHLVGRRTRLAVKEGKSTHFYSPFLRRLCAKENQSWGGARIFGVARGPPLNIVAENISQRS